MRCSDFINLYSDYRDGLVTDSRLCRRLAAHVSRCRHCAQYHEALGRGVELLREDEGIEPSERFRVKLRCQLAVERRRRRRRAVLRARVGATVVVMAGITIVVYGGVSNSPHQVDVTPAPIERPMPMVTANAGYPFVTFVELDRPALPPRVESAVNAPSEAVLDSGNAGSAQFRTVPATLPR
jgi:anti-sigma factor RsiW